MAVIALTVSQSFSQTVTRHQTGEEFSGPLSTWKSVADFGARGDDDIDDAPAIQKALDAMKNVQTNQWSVLYFPKGR